MALSLKQVKDICFVGGGSDQCRYLDEEYDNNGNALYLCKKKSPDKKVIDDEVTDFLNDMMKAGEDPMDQGVALADSCTGYVVLKTKPQGYDIKP